MMRQRSVIKLDLERQCPHIRAASDDAATVHSPVRVTPVVCPHIRAASDDAALIGLNPWMPLYRVRISEPRQMMRQFYFDSMVASGMVSAYQSRVR